ncbi:hypothetical protein TNCV_3177601 [Trichonephila clavipes]|nr:hypothetical protein TNCV_3177601 [Trichonephila clavipes]
MPNKGRLRYSSGHGYGLVAVARHEFEPNDVTTHSAKGLMHVKTVKAQSPPTSLMWKFGERWFQFRLEHLENQHAEKLIALFTGALEKTDLHYRSYLRSNCPQSGMESFTNTKQADMHLIYGLAEGNAGKRKDCIAKSTHREMHRIADVIISVNMNHYEVIDIVKAGHVCDSNYKNDSALTNKYFRRSQYCVFSFLVPVIIFSHDAFEHGLLCRSEPL